jgi:hypothetical protein
LWMMANPPHHQPTYVTNLKKEKPLHTSIPQ